MFMELLKLIIKMLRSLKKRVIIDRFIEMTKHTFNMIFDIEKSNILKIEYIPIMFWKIMYLKTQGIKV